MTIAVRFPVLLLIACRLSYAVPCRNYVEKPSFVFNTSSLEYLYENEKSFLNFCAAANYCHIQWFKNDQPLYPSQNFTDGHLVVKDDGRMLSFSPVLASDEGIYTCNATNNAGSVIRTQELRVDKIPPCPFFTNQSYKASDRYLEVGASHSEKWEINAGNRDLSCQFVKEINLDINTTDVGNCSASVCGECYPDPTRPNIWYADFNLTGITEENFGTYKFAVCESRGSCTCLTAEIKISQNQTPNVEVKSTTVVSIICSIILVVVLCILTWHFIKVDVQLFVKDHLHRTEAYDGRSYDAYISYAWTDTDRMFVLQLKSHLEKRGYRVYVPEIDNLPGGCTALQLTEALQKSRRFIMVLSPEYIRAHFTAFEVNIFIEVVTRYKDVIIPIVFQGLQYATDESAILRHVLKVGQTVTWARIEWPLTENSVCDNQLSLDTIILENSSNSNTVMEKSFRMKGYKQLLLKLPPKPERTINDFYLLD